MNRIIHGDCLDELKKLPDNSIDSCVTDPPYGLSKEPDIVEVLTKWLDGEDYHHRGGGFMGKTWDSFVPGPSIWREVYRVLKPGAHLLCFAGTRTQDLMTISLRLAGFEIRDVIEWLYFSGFPKSMDVGKAIDKRAGAEREIVGPYKYDNRRKEGSGIGFGDSCYGTYGRAPKGETAPATDLAKKWDGWGTALKPAHEPIILARKPLDGTVADNVERWGTGAINIDGCRIGTDLMGPGISGGGKSAGSFGLDGFSTLEELKQAAEKGEKTPNGRNAKTTYERYLRNQVEKKIDVGRFPANCVTTEPDAFYSKYFNVTPPELCKKASKKDRNSDWRGEEISLPLREKVFGNDKGDGFGRGLSDSKYSTRNNHPTVKPTDLMAWLVRLITPPGGTVLDPFAGSGSTLVAAKREGFSYVGIEREEEYVEIARARVDGDPQEENNLPEGMEQMELFDDAFAL